MQSFFALFAALAFSFVSISAATIDFDGATARIGGARAVMMTSVDTAVRA